jgi:diaminopimelate decarboxylase
VVDSFDELDRLDALHDETGVVPEVLIRVTPGIEAHTHEFVQTGQDDSKFGFGLQSGLARSAVDRATAAASVELVGLHAHIGSQIYALDSFTRSVEALAPFVNECGLPELSVGGGLGVAYREGEEALTITRWAGAIHAACSAHGITARITAEPGRAIAASAAITVYTVGTIKDLPGIRTYVSVDGGMSDNPRPILYGSGYETFLPRAVAAERSRPVTVVGKHCESGDVLVRDAHVPDDLAVGDLLATAVTGAYGYSMRPTTTWCLGPPSCSSPTARCAWSPAGRRSTICSAATSTEALLPAS